MSEVKAYKGKIKLTSSVENRFEADTVWGSIVWAIRYLYGKEEADNFINSYSSSPAIIISDFFPSGYLPGPLLEPNMEIVEDIFKSFIKDIPFEKLKNIFQKSIMAPLLPAVTVKNLIKDSSILYTTMELIFKGTLCPCLLKPIDLMSEEKHNISSLIKKTCNITSCPLLKGSLYRECRKILSNFNPLFHNYKYKEGEEWDFYILSSMDKDRLVNILEFLGLNGYGKNSSRGKGHFNLMDFSVLSEEERIDRYTGEENGFMTISSYIPLPGEIEEPLDGRFKILIKMGRLGGHYSSLKNFLKYPLVLVRAGSIFPASPDEKNNWGQFAKNIHPDIAEIVQYGWAFPVWGNFFDKR